MSDGTERYCVYARRPGWLGWLTPWTLVGISPIREVGLSAGYGPEFLNRGFMIQLVKTSKLPLVQQFYKRPAEFQLLEMAQRRKR